MCNHFKWVTVRTLLSHFRWITHRNSADIRSRYRADTQKESHGIEYNSVGPNFRYIFSTSISSTCECFARMMSESKKSELKTNNKMSKAITYTYICTKYFQLKNVCVIEIWNMCYCWLRMVGELLIYAYIFQCIDLPLLMLLFWQNAMTNFMLNNVIEIICTWGTSESSTPSHVSDAGVSSSCNHTWTAYSCVYNHWALNNKNSMCCVRYRFIVCLSNRMEIVLLFQANKCMRWGERESDRELFKVYVNTLEFIKWKHIHSFENDLLEWNQCDPNVYCS